jgi:hypothetical protein
MCSPSNVFQLISTWADIAAVDGLSTGIQGGLWSLLGMCAPQIQVVAALTIAVCVVSLVILHRHRPIIPHVGKTVDAEGSV